MARIVTTVMQQKRWGETRIIYQVNKGIAGKLGAKGAVCFFDGIRRIGRGRWDYTLFDMSGGRGAELDLDAGKDFREFSKKFKGLQAGVAGGIAPDTIGRIVSEVGRDISFDVESRVRDNNDELDVEKANAYLGNAAKALS